MLEIYNTLTKSKQAFKPLNDKQVKFFVCGPTVYDHIQLGNAKTYVQMDIIARILRYLGYQVHYLQNITDIDDKIILKSSQTSQNWTVITEKYLQSYYADIKTLNVTSVDNFARATDHIEQIINQVERLVEKGFAYKISDGIYFEVSKFTDYGKLSGRHDVKKDDAQSRIDESKEKKGWNDFCLWKFSKAGEPSWPAPFGDGRPGWHIEDTAITEKFFGAQYDIHGGGIDLIFPHHEAEITQMEAISGKKPLVQAWVHSGFLTINGNRMGKSNKNFFTVKDVIDKGYEPMALRLLFAQSHYRSSVDFSWEILDSASQRLKRWRASADLRWQPLEDFKIDGADKLFETARNNLKLELENDFDTPAVLTEIEKIFDLVTDGVPIDNVNEYNKFLKDIDNILGLKLLDSGNISESQQNLLKKRQLARQNNDYSLSDQLRDELASKGLDVRDTEQGQLWSRN